MTNIKTISLRLPEDLLDRIRAAANEDRRNVSNWIRYVVEDKLDEQDALTREAEEGDVPGREFDETSHYRSER